MDVAVGTLHPKGSRLVGQLNRTTSVQIALRLPEPDVTRARELATRKGIGYQTLLKMLVHEGLRREGATTVIRSVPETVRHELNGHRTDIAYTDAEGNDRKLTTSGGNKIVSRTCPLISTQWCSCESLIRTIRRSGPLRRMAQVRARYTGETCDGKGELALRQRSDLRNGRLTSVRSILSRIAL